MPSLRFPITIASPPPPPLLEDTILTLEIGYVPKGISSGYPEINRFVNILITNGEAIETIPYWYIAGGQNFLNIVGISGPPTLVSVMFADESGIWVNNFELVSATLKSYTRNTIAPLLLKYQALHNFLDPGEDISDDRNYNSPFRTMMMGLTESSILDLKLQPSYDGSINMIWTDDNGPMRIVNSRFAVDETGTYAELIDRRARKDANTYNDEYFHQTELIPKATTIPTLTFDGLMPGGRLPGGGYRYFLKYVTADGAETDIIEESRLVSVHDGDSTISSVGNNGTAATSNSVKFTVSDLDQSFYGIVVYFTKAVGEVDSIQTAYKIDSPFIIENNGTCTIIHTGFEQTSLIDIATLSLTYSIISRAKTLDVVNNRLLVGNTDADDVYDKTLAQAASLLKIEEGAFDIKQSSLLDAITSPLGEDNYSNPEFIYNKLGYWKGETYELGVVFVTASGLSPVYPTSGIDFYTGTTAYAEDLLGGLYRGFAMNGQNSAGIYRTEHRHDLWTIDGDTLTFSGTNLKVDIETFKFLDDVTGFFFVRRKRKKDAILQGLLVPSATVPIESKFGSEYEIAGFGNWCGVGVNSSVAKKNVKFVPAPGGTMPFGVEETAAGTSDYVAYLDASKKQVVTVGAVGPGATSAVLSYVTGLVANVSTIQFIGVDTKLITSVDTGTNTVGWAGGLTIPSGTNISLLTASGSGTSTDFYTIAPIRDFEDLNAFTLYSPDTDCAPTYYASILSSTAVGLFCTKQAFTYDNVTVIEGSPLTSESLLYAKITSDLDPTVSQIATSRAVTANYVDTGATGVAALGFSGSTDRNLYLFWGYIVGDSHLTRAYVTGKIGGALDQFSSTRAVDLAIGSRPGNCLAFGRYIGIKAESTAMSAEFIAMTLEPDPTDENTNAYISLDTPALGWLNGVTPALPQLGYVSTLYSNEFGVALDQSSWEARYLADEDSEYSAVTKRYRWSDFFDEFHEVKAGVPTTVVDIYGGDCFLGMQWKQVWSPLGIIEAPQTNDINAYKLQRRSLGLLPYGYAIPVPAQSNYNFNVRSKERVDEREYKVYGTDRSFLPIKGIQSIRGDRQYETGSYNQGYSSEGTSAAKQFRLNLNAPFYRFKYPNRVYVSAESGENEFVNGFSNFKGLNFKDYNTNLGAITKLIALNNVLICVFKDGVAQIGVDERSQISNDTGGVFVDAAQVLSRSNVINSDYGSSHLHSVCASNNYVYGVDFGRQKVWRTNGSAMELISDLKVQNKMASISKELLEVLGEGTESWLDIYGQFDSRKNEIYFTFVVRDPNNIDEWNKSRTIVFKETADVWVCETNDTRKFIFQSNEYRYAFPSVVGKYNKLYRYNIPHLANVDPTIDVYGEYNKFYDEIYDMSFDYHVIDEASLFKIFSNIYVIGNNSLPTKVTYTSDFNTVTEQELIPYTNVRYPIRDVNGVLMTVSGTAGSQTLTITQAASIKRPQQSYLQYGDFISLIDPFDPHVHYNYVVIEYVPGSHIVLDKELTRNVANEQLYFGYGSNLPMRLTDSSLEEGYGVVTCQFNNRTARGQSPAKLRGKWMRFKQTYEGTAPVYISGIITDYGISLS